MSIILVDGSSNVPDAPPASNRYLRMEWQSWDGTKWDLAGLGGVWLMTDSVEGMHFPPIDKFKSRSRVVPGARTRGFQVRERPVFWPLVIDAKSSTDWMARQAPFFRSIRPDRAGKWTVTTGASSRFVELTGTFETMYAYARDPYRFAYAYVPLELEADNPMWTDTVPQERAFRASGANRPFIDPAGSPAFHISSGNVFETAAIDNPGDIDGYLVWEVVGPMAGIEIGVGGSVITVPFDVAAGETLIIDTDPRNQFAMIDGEHVNLGFQSFKAVAPGSSMPLSVAALGTGQIIARLRPLYYRAF